MGGSSRPVPSRQVERASYYDRALHPISPATRFKARSYDLNLLGFPGTSIPGPMDLGQGEHTERPQEPIQ